MKPVGFGPIVNRSVYKFQVEALARGTEAGNAGPLRPVADGLREAGTGNWAAAPAQAPALAQEGVRVGASSAVTASATASLTCASVGVGRPSSAASWANEVIRTPGRAQAVNVV